MINIKRLFLVCVTFLLFLSFSEAYAQRVNQFDANKKRTGLWRKYHPNKRIRYTGKFKDGKEVGTFKFYNMSNSRLPDAVKIFHKNSDSVTVKYFFDKGKIKGRGKLFGRKKVGKWIYFYKKGGVFSEENFVDGKLSGHVIINFKRNGKVAEDSEYKEGLLNGISKKYSDDGVLIEDVLFKDGKANGLAKYYELNGDLKEKGVYKNGVRVGKWEFYIGGEEVDEKTKRAARKTKIKN